MTIKFYITLVIFLTISSASVPTESAEVIQRTSNASINVVTTDTHTPVGEAIARNFTQTLFLQDIRIRSDLSIREAKVSGNSSEISLLTPLRIVSSHRLKLSRNNDSDVYKSIANSFISAAQKQGLITANTNKNT